MIATGVATAVLIPGGEEAKGAQLLTRYGSEAATTTERLAAEAAKAEAHPNYGVHGVSVTSKPNPLHEAGSAMRSEVEKLFTVKKTGNNPHHFTVELPKPVTDAVTKIFNRLFFK